METQQSWCKTAPQRDTERARERQRETEDRRRRHIDLLVAGIQIYATHPALYYGCVSR